MTFTVFPAKNGDWRITKTFSNEADVSAWCETITNVKAYYKVDVSKSGNGTVSSIGDIMVASGESLTLTVGAPTALYDGVDSVSSVSNEKFVLSNVAADHEVVVIYTYVTNSTQDKPASGTVKIGDKVRVKNGAKTYTGGGLASFVYDNVYDVIQMEDDRVVIGKGKAVTAVVKASDLLKV